MQLVKIGCALALFAASGLSFAQQKKAIPPALFAQVIADHYSDADTRTPASANISFRALDLNGDDTNEYLIEGGFDYCGSRGCALWIYKQAGDKYTNIYSGNGIADLAKFEKSITRLSTNGYPDLLFKSDSIANENEIYFITSYFDGKKYNDYNPCK